MDAAETTSGAALGRHANAPWHIPLSGWKEIIFRVVSDFLENRILLTAAGVTFFVLLSLVPTLSAVVTLYGLFNDSNSVLNHIQLLSGFMPPSALDLLNDQLTRLISASNDSLGWTFLLSLVIALWSASAGVKALFEAMNVAYKEKERRSFIAVNALGLFFTFAGAIVTVVVLTVVLVMPAVLQFSPAFGLDWAVRLGSYAVMLATLAFMVSAFYRWGPSRRQAKWRWIMPGVLISLILLAATSVGFSWYVTNFPQHNAASGSLGAVIGLMTWIWLSSTIVIVGAVLNASIELQTGRDSTLGPARPLGSRGAYVADTIAGSPAPNIVQLDGSPSA
ncbi:MULTISPECIES: YihY/virulence factor BrkB family protein [unclassified Devosia]|uniref:YihY/virulence factor BrkB family protein n=1 Tax=unclassified Devosia TaxID=196773 RepID=UPI00145C9ECF|nr:MULTISPECIES: YihY/virulence factor BrkB family protein [unclassified Devosia]MBJ6988664.1 YihY/virulence factor BrkB family protein [Devosia sp. MC521]QMW62161.1 YihY/virulence factor BrkB family protein [Devosia sp. MC521]